MRRGRGPSAQRGVALVTAMFVVAIVATLSAFLAVSQQVWLRQAQNLSDLAQVEAIGRGAVGFAAVLLAQDTNRNVDYLSEKWNEPIPPLPVEGGFVTIRIEDAQSRFNLNNVVSGGQAKKTEVDILRRLLRNFDLDPALADAVVDWIDSDSVVQGGAEDLDYINLPTPYRTGSQPLQTVDELRRIKGFSGEIVDQLRPHVTALPNLGDKAINVNTAGADVLAALTDIPPAAIKPLLEARGINGFTEKKTFADQVPKKIDATYDVKTQFFLVKVETSIGRIVRRTEALLERQQQGNKSMIVRWHQPQPLQIVRDDSDTQTPRP